MQAIAVIRRLHSFIFCIRTFDIFYDKSVCRTLIIEPVVAPALRKSKWTYPAAFYVTVVVGSGCSAMGEMIHAGISVAATRHAVQQSRLLHTPPCLRT